MIVTVDTNEFIPHYIAEKVHQVVTLRMPKELKRRLAR